MSRVLVTGGAGAIGGAIVRRLLADPAYEVRVSDRRAVPQWMREGAEVHEGDLRARREARAALDGCTHVIHLAGLDGDAYSKEESVVEDAEGGATVAARRTPFTMMEASSATCSAVIGAAVEPQARVERFVYVSSATVCERASEFPTSEAYLAKCPTPVSPYGFAMLAGEMYCRAAHEEHGLTYTICRPFDAYGPGMRPSTMSDLARVPEDVSHSATGVSELIARALSGETPLRMTGSGEQTKTPTNVDDVAGGVIAAMGSPAGINEDFNIAAARELTMTEIGHIVWETCGRDPEAFAWESSSTDTLEARRSCPSVEKARRLLGWEARIEFEQGIAATVEWIRALGSVGSAP
jgi:UDP-glucose 4-epimerase